jgi:hypothetical protein
MDVVQRAMPARPDLPRTDTLSMSRWLTDSGTGWSSSNIGAGAIGLTPGRLLFVARRQNWLPAAGSHEALPKNYSTAPRRLRRSLHRTIARARVTPRATRQSRKTAGAENTR